MESSDKFGTCHDVIVVGAGISGLTASKVLREAGLSVVIVEAQDRIGGRLYPLNCDILENSSTIDVNKLKEDAIFIEAGANWVHDISKANPIFRMTQKMGLSLCEMYSNDHEIDPRSIIGDRNHAYTTGEHRIFSKQELREASNLCHNLFEVEAWNVYKKLRKGNSTTRNTTTLTEALQKATSRYESKHPPLSEAARQLLAWRLEGEGMSNAEDLDKLSFASWCVDTPEDEHGEALVVGGISQILTPLSRNEDIVLNCPVREVIWNPIDDSEPMAIVTDRGEMKAWNVIVTAPLGCLKENTISFQPSLPSKTEQAIDALHMGLLSVVVFRFHSIFWPESCLNFGVPPSSTYDWSRISETHNAVEFNHREYPPTDLFYSFLSLSATRPDKCPLLLAYVYGSRARQVERMSEEDISAAAFSSLQTIFGHDVALPPVRCVLHRWGLDPYARGSYSVLAVGANREAMEALSAPVNRKKSPCTSSGEDCPFSTCSLQFAGEATEFELIGLLQGAYASGERAARRIIQKKR